MKKYLLLLLIAVCAVSCGKDEESEFTLTFEEVVGFYSTPTDNGNVSFEIRQFPSSCIVFDGVNIPIKDVYEDSDQNKDRASVSIRCEDYTINPDDYDKRIDYQFNVIIGGDKKVKNLSILRTWWKNVTQPGEFGSWQSVTEEWYYSNFI